MRNPESTAKIGNHPIHPMIIPFPIAFLVGAFASDAAYWYSGNAFFATGSLWLLGAGIVMALAAALFGFIDFFGDQRIRDISAAWQHMVGNLIVVVLAAVNFYLRYANGAGDTAGVTGPDAGAATAGDPILTYGIWISLVTVLLLLFNGWKGWDMVYEHHVGVADKEGGAR